MTESLWIDITQLCKDAANRLTDTNSMLTYESFSLEAIMSATEIMDPKMDQFCGCNCDLSLDELLNTKVPSSFDESTLVTLIQALIIQEASHLDGWSLLETVHQCIYLWDDSWNNLLSPSESDMNIRILLKSYAEATSKSLQYIDRSILDIDIFEDEDFTPANISIGSGLDDEYVEKALENSFIINDSSDFKLKNDIRVLFRLRMELFKFYQLYNKIASFSLRQFNSVNFDGKIYESSRNELESMLEMLESIIVSVRKSITSILNDFASSEFGATGLNRDISNKDDFPEISFAFNSMVSKMQRPGPIRFINYRTFRGSLTYLDELLVQVSESSSITRSFISESKNGSFNIEDVLAEAVLLGEKKVHLLARCIFYSTIRIFSVDISVILNSMRHRGIPMSFLQTSMAITENYFDVLSLVFWDTIKVLSSHRNRVLPKLDSVLASWGSLIFESHALDREVREKLEIHDEKQQWFLYWVLVLTTHLMDVHLGLLQEYDLIASNEYDGYMYYRDYICTYRAAFVEKLRELEFTVERSLYLDSLETESQLVRENRIRTQYKGKKTVKAIKDLNSDDSGVKSEAMKNLSSRGIIPPVTSNPSVTELYLRARSQFYRGSLAMITCMLNIKAISKNENEFMSMAWRFHNRFRAFHSIPNPTMVRYDDIIKTPGPGEYDVDPLELLAKASLCFLNSKKLIEELRKAVPKTKEEKYYQTSAVSIAKAVIVNSVSCTKATQIIESFAVPEVDSLSSSTNVLMKFRRTKVEGASSVYSIPKTANATIEKLASGFISINFYR